MPKRLRRVNGTKEFRRGRQCIIVKDYDGGLIIDRIHPKHWNELAARMIGHYGHGHFQMRERDMRPDESYLPMDLPREAA